MAPPHHDGLISHAPLPANQTRSGLLLLGCAVVALLWANSPWSGAYHALWHLPVGGMSLLHVINDGLMALFFLMVGLEIKHELQDGALATRRTAALPVVAALGGMLLPAALYLTVTGDNTARAGWGIPMATDIAFALGIVALLGQRVPASLRLLLAALAIVDDLGAVLVIALFYTPSIVNLALVAAALIMSALFWLNRRGVCALTPYAVLGVLLWIAVLKSGVHASIAGVLFAITIPARGIDCVQSKLEQLLHTPVAFLIIPLFALANAGVTFTAQLGASVEQAAVIGTVLGLVFGKPLGIVSAMWIAWKLKVVDLPDGAGWGQIWGIAALGGIGFTMSLFIAGLAFGEGAVLDAAKVGVLLGSLIAGIIGAVLLTRRAAPRATALPHAVSRPASA